MPKSTAIRSFDTKDVAEEHKSYHKQHHIDQQHESARRNTVKNISQYYRAAAVTAGGEVIGELKEINADGHQLRTQRNNKKTRAFLIFMYSTI